MLFVGSPLDNCFTKIKTQRCGNQLCESFSFQPFDFFSDGFFFPLIAKQ